MSTNSVEEAFAKLEENIELDDLFLSEFQENLIEQLNNSSSDEKYLNRIFELFEKYPGADWGMPGELVHYLESQDTCLFEKALISSIERCPVDHTLWMLNRQCNSKHNKEDIDKYCSIFKNAAERDDVSKSAVESAADFLEYQQERIRNLKK